MIDEQEQEKLPEILRTLDGSSPFCANCGHHFKCHVKDRVPVCDYDAIGTEAKGRIECSCKGFNYGDSDI